jgi:hypothetical protein
MAATLARSVNTIKVCEQDCVYNASASTENKAVCTLPELATKTSAEKYKITESGVLDGTWTGSGSAEEVAKAHDKNNLVDYVDSKNPCFVQLSMKAGYVAVLDEAKFFINHLTNKAYFVDKLKL